MNQQYQFNQYEHKELYGLPRTAKLKGFVVVNEEKEDMLAMIQHKNGLFLSAYTESPTQALIFKTVDKAKAMIEEIGESEIEYYLLNTKVLEFLAENAVVTEEEQPDATTVSEAVGAVEEATQDTAETTEETTDAAADTEEVTEEVAE